MTKIMIYALYMAYHEGCKNCTPATQEQIAEALALVAVVFTAVKLWRITHSKTEPPPTVLSQTKEKAHK